MGRVFVSLRALKLVAIALAIGFPTQATESWTATSRTNSPSVHVSRTAMDGQTIFRGGCNKLLGPGLTGSFASYQGNALRRSDDKREPITFEITGKLGREPFPGQVHYFAGEKTWNIAGLLPPNFVSALGRGEKLTVRNGKGEVAFSFNLDGAFKAVEAMQRGCGLSPAAAGQKQEPDSTGRRKEVIPAQFGKQCVACMNEAHRLGRSVGGFCPGSCTEVYEKMICDNRGVNCKPGP